MNSISKLDYFAAHATEEDIQSILPKTVGAVRDKLIELGYIPSNRRYTLSALDSYTDKEALLLRPWARYEFAKMMLALSEINGEMK